MIKLLLGGSPCTHWSIAQKNNREVVPSGIGWELFENYLLALEKYKPDYFLYENNKSAAPAIKDRISRELGVPLQYINSALVSAQNRQRFYAHNIPGVPLPEDRGILLRDVLESGKTYQDKSYCLCANYYKAGENPRHPLTRKRGSVAAEPIRIGTIENDAKNPDNDSQQYRVYSPDGKSVTLCGNGGGIGAKTGLYVAPVGTTTDEKAFALTAYYSTGQNPEHTLKKHIGSMAAEPVMFQNPHGYNEGGIKYDEAPTMTAAGKYECNNFVIEWADGKTYPVYEVADGTITIKGNQYPIKLADGYYIIRKLSVLECKRLQTVPDDYIFPVSNTQSYKQLGNGWTVDVIAHILSYIPGIREQEIEVLSMYDGMSCGHIALDKLGANIVRYYATEIDKYAIQTTQVNYPNTV